MIFSILRFFCTLRFQILKKLYLDQILSYPYKPYINGKLIYSAFGLCINLNCEKLTLKTGFVVQCHKCKLCSSLVLIKNIMRMLIPDNTDNTAQWTERIGDKFKGRILNISVYLLKVWRLWSGSALFSHFHVMLFCQNGALRDTQCMFSFLSSCVYKIAGDWNVWVPCLRPFPERDGILFPCVCI